jgi:hypothetical protein
MADPAISSHTDGDTFTNSMETFTWSQGDNANNKWRLIAGSSAGASDYHDSGPLPNNRLSWLMNLPADAETIYVRLMWGSGYADTSYTAYTAVDEMVPNAMRFDWFEQGRWYQCDRCGFTFHESDTAIDPRTGLRVCTIGPNDYDEPDTGRDAVVLTNPRTPYYTEED